MRSFLSLVLLSVFLCGCNGRTQQEEPTESLSLFEEFVKSYYESKGDYFKNSALTAKYNEELTDTLRKVLQQENLLSDLPLMFENVSTVNGKNYTLFSVGFSYSPVKLNQIHFELLATVDNKTLSELETGKEYYLDGTFKEFFKDGVDANKKLGYLGDKIENSLAFLDFGYWVRDKQVEIKMLNKGDTLPSINCGILYYEVDSLKIVDEAPL